MEKKAGSRGSKKEKKMEKHKVKRDAKVGQIGLLHIISFSMPYESLISIKQWPQ